MFAIGSCFAVEIRAALRAFGYDVYPKYFDVEIDPEKHTVGKLPERDNVNHYDTFVIRQEIERAVGRGRYGQKDFWEIAGHRRAKRMGVDAIWQDPYRRDVFAVSADECQCISDRVSQSIDDGLRAAEVVVITLGLTETWRHRGNGLFVCQGPKTDSDPVWGLADPHLSIFGENKANVLATIDAIRSLDPGKQVVLTVSPVALGRTFSGQDIVVANMQSKSTLRAVAGEVVRERPDVIYWPSYEFAMMEDHFEADGRHVRRDAVEQIISAFLTAHASPG